MGKSPGAQADQLSASQRSTIRRTVQDAIASHDVEWAMRNTCVELEEKYGVSRDTIEYLLHDELPSALPEELLSANQKHRLRQEFQEANSIPDSRQREDVIAAVFNKYQDLYGVSQATLQAVVGAAHDGVRHTEPPPGESSLPVAPSLPEPGQVVEVRGSTWAVANVQAQGLPRSPADEATANPTLPILSRSLSVDLPRKFPPTTGDGNQTTGSSRLQT
jgi:hypothetical protein